jgi:hypothetical protein
MGLADKKMLALSSEYDTIIGSFKCRDSMIFDCVSAGADAVNAIKGASVNALRPPSLSNAVLKSRPLYTHSGIVTNLFQGQKLTTHTHNELRL